MFPKGPAFFGEMAKNDVFLMRLYRKMRVVKNTRSEDVTRKFIRYSIWAWSYPGITCAITFAMDFVPYIKNTIFAPKFHNHFMCWFDGEFSTIRIWVQKTH